MKVTRILPIILAIVVPICLYGQSTPGQIDTNFNAVGVATMPGFTFSTGNAQAIQQDGKIVVCGVAQVGSQTDFLIARYNTNGTLDTTFSDDGIVTASNGPGNDECNAVVLQPDGKIVAAGKASIENSIGLIRLNSDGTIDNTFGSFGRVSFPIASNQSYANGIVLQPDGKFVVSASVSNFNEPSKVAIARFLSNGSPDSTFGNGGATSNVIGIGNARVTSIARQADGKFVMAGRYVAPGGDTDGLVVRFTTDGVLDTSFDVDGIIITPFGQMDDEFNAVKVQSDGKIVAAGYISDPANPNFKVALARFHPNGSPDTTFDADGKATSVGTQMLAAASLAIQDNGKLVVVGFNRMSDLSYKGMVARFNPDGTMDNSFGTAGVATSPSIGAYDIFFAVSVQSDGKIVTSGTSSQSSSKMFIARFIGDAVAQAAKPFDYDGDGRSDISIYRPASGQWWLDRSSAGTTAFTFGSAADKIVPADYTGDGKTDVAIWRASTGQWLVLRSEDSSFYALPFGSSTDKPAPGDYDGDRKADIAVFRQSTGTWYIQRSTDGGTTIFGFGANGDVPMVGDYDADGQTDAAIFRPSNGQWWLRRSTAGVIATTFGNSADKPTPADFTGDGKTDIAFWRPSTGEWYVLRSENSSFYAFPFGISTDIAAPGDFDGDGKADAAVFRPSNGTWYINRSSGGTTIRAFGANGDAPTQAAFIP